VKASLGNDIAPDRGKSPCERMNFCNRLLQTKILMKTRVWHAPQKLELLQLFGRPAAGWGRKSGIGMKLCERLQPRVLVSAAMDGALPSPSLPFVHETAQH
jgi:hypothetical protein